MKTCSSGEQSREGQAPSWRVSGLPALGGQGQLFLPGPAGEQGGCAPGSWVSVLAPGLAPARPVSSPERRPREHMTVGVSRCCTFSSRLSATPTPPSVSFHLRRPRKQAHRSARPAPGCGLSSERILSRERSTPIGAGAPGAGEARVRGLRPHHCGQLALFLHLRAQVLSALRVRDSPGRAGPGGEPGPRISARCPRA